MILLQRMKNGIEAIVNGMARIFSPLDDEYPAIGMQPFEGEPNPENL